MHQNNNYFNTQDFFSLNESKCSPTDIMEIGLQNLSHYSKHPFKLYTGQRFADLVESIKTNGLFSPIIVRPIIDDKYEILSGHNRYEACKLAGFQTITSIVKRNLTEDEAYLIVVESNLIQRSFESFSHSEKALALATHYETMKRQGRRTDLLKEIEDMITINENTGDNFASPMDTKLRSDEKLGEQYGLNRNTIARYIRINKLIDLFKEKIDKNELSIRAGVTLSYLTDDEQRLVVDIADFGNCKIDIKKAEKLKEYSQQQTLIENVIEHILIGRKNLIGTRLPNIFKFKSKRFKKYFDENQTINEIEDIFDEALSFYFENKADTKKQSTKIEEDLSDFDLFKVTSN